MIIHCGPIIKRLTIEDTRETTPQHAHEGKVGILGYENWDVF